MQDCKWTVKIWLNLTMEVADCSNLKNNDIKCSYVGNVRKSALARLYEYGCIRNTTYDGHIQ